MPNSNQMVVQKFSTTNETIPAKAKIIHFDHIQKKKERNQFLQHLSFNTLNKRDYVLIILCLFVMFASIIYLITYQDQISVLQKLQMNTWWGIGMFYVGTTLFSIKIGFLLYLTYLYSKYKSVASCTDDELPICTVIVPAYNEGKLVYETLLSLSDSNYPKEKLQILSIDDGSKDDTWQWMCKAKQVLGDRLTIHQQPENKGKRHALYHGFTTGIGEVFITVDSDSVVNESTLRNLVSPFVTNKNCGAVAGNVRVLNKQNGLIPKMLNVSFTFSFEFVRSAQSVLGSVLCTPGALAAYRKDVVLNCLDEWMNQTFMGQKSTIGEDRALTNMILKQGKDVVFQKKSLVFTNIPEHYTNLYKMFVRWERSNVRENIKMSQFAFTNFRKRSTFGPRLLLSMQWLKVIMAFPILIMLFVFIVTNPLLFLTTSLSGILIFSSIQMVFYANKYNLAEGFLSYVYSVFYMFSLFWITPYAIVTAAKSGWLTRELPLDK